MTTLDAPAVAAGSVWATGQDTPAVQRRGRYVPESMAHPAKMLPAVAAHAIAAYTQPGEPVLDPMCGIGTTLVEALHQGRRAVGVEYETRWAEIARTNLELTGPARRGLGQVYTGDARHLDWLVPADLLGQAALVVTSRTGPPPTAGSPPEQAGCTSATTSTGTCSTAATWQHRPPPATGRVHPHPHPHHRLPAARRPGCDHCPG